MNWGLVGIVWVAASLAFCLGWFFGWQVKVGQYATDVAERTGERWAQDRELRERDVERQVQELCDATMAILQDVAAREPELHEFGWRQFIRAKLGAWWKGSRVNPRRSRNGRVSLPSHTHQEADTQIDPPIDQTPEDQGSDGAPRR